MRRKFSDPVMLFAQQRSLLSQNKSSTHNNAHDFPHISNSAHTNQNALLKSLFVAANLNLDVWNVNKRKKLTAHKRAAKPEGNSPSRFNPLDQVHPLYYLFNFQLTHHQIVEDGRQTRINRHCGILHSIRILVGSGPPTCTAGGKLNLKPPWFYAISL